MKNTSGSRLLATFAGLVILLAIFLTSTNPNELPVAALVAPILLVFFASFTGTLLICDLFRLFGQHKKRRRSLAATVATLMAIAVVLGSSGAIVVGDIILIALILLVAWIYISNF